MNQTIADVHGFNERSRMPPQLTDAEIADLIDENDLLRKRIEQLEFELASALNNRDANRQDTDIAQDAIGRIAQRLGKRK